MNKIMNINYAKARNKALSLRRSGFGKTTAIKNYYIHILSYIDLQELTQIVAIAYYRTKTEGKTFYSMISNELAYMGLYRNKRKEVVNFIIEDFKNNRQIKQLHNLYRAIGFDLFFEYLNFQVPKTTVRKWTWKAFAKRKNEARLSIKTKRQIKRILETGGKIRFSQSSSSVYIENNEVTVRISDHSQDATQDFDQIQIQYVRN